MFKELVQYDSNYYYQHIVPLKVESNYTVRKYLIYFI